MKGKFILKAVECYTEKLEEENKKDIEWSELGKRRGRRLNDALYFLNEIKECVKND